MRCARHLRLILMAAAVAATVACAHRAPVPQPPTPAAAAPAPAPDPDAAKMPDAPGKADVVRVCSGCHTLERVVREHQSRQQWQATLEEMKGNGLFASPAELAAILNYLSQNYGPQQP